MILANGECEYTSDDAEREHSEGMARCLDDYDVTLGRVGHLDGCEGIDGTRDCYCGDLGFSWHRCDGCGSNLGGDRYAATLWLDNESEVTK